MRQPFQNVYVRLCVDARARAAFSRDRDAALSGEDLTDAERATLRDLDGDALGRFAASLLAKRADELRPFVRLTAVACPDLEARYRRWLADHPAPATDDDAALPSGLREALRALDPLRAALRADPAAAPFAADVLAFEVMEAAARLDHIPRALRVRYHLPSVLADLRRGVLPADPPPGPVEVSFTAEGARWRPWRASGAAQAPTAPAPAPPAPAPPAPTPPTPAPTTAPAPHPRALRAGVAYRHRYRAALLSPDLLTSPDRPQVLEVMAEHFFRDPAALDALADAYPLIFHEVGFSPATTWDDTPILHRVRDLCRRAPPLLFTEHLALTRSPGPAPLSLGHLAPPLYTLALLDHLTDRLRRWQDVLGAPVALETITAPFLLPHSPLDEPAFLHLLTERTSCGVLLDLTNLLINAHNLGFDPAQRLRDYPLHAVWVVHLSGGHRDPDGHWIDSHAAPVPDAAFDLLHTLCDLGAPNLQAVLIERDGAWPPLSDLCAEATRARTHRAGDSPNPSPKDTPHVQRHHHR